MKVSIPASKILIILAMTQLYNVNASAKSKFNKKELQITASVRPLTNEEAMEYINEEQLVVDIDKRLSLLDMPILNSNQAMDENDYGTYPIRRGDFNRGVVPNLGQYNQIQMPNGLLGNIFMVTDKLIAVGERLMPTIQKGAPVVTNNSMNAVSILPRGLTTDNGIYVIDNWSFPVTKYFTVSLKGAAGTVVAKFDYGVTYQYNGRYDGKGKYLTGIRVAAKKITVSWGYDLDAKSQLLNISNVGRDGEVVAAATLEMQYTVKNMFKTRTNTMQIFVTGDNKIKIN